MSENIINALVYEVCQLSKGTNLGNYFFVSDNGQYTTLSNLISYLNNNVDRYTNSNITIYINVNTTTINFEDLNETLQNTMYISLEISPNTVVTDMII
jgi:hypothetical protein